MRRLSAGLSLAVVGLGLLCFYSWTATNGRSFAWGEPQDGFYNLLTDALLHGQLHLRLEPQQDLFELPEPYEPSRNVEARLHDASLYKGRYYLYFGVAPAVVLFAPWRLLGLGDLPEGLGATIFGFAGFVFFGLLLRDLLRRHLPSTSLWARLVSLLTLGLASVVPFALRGASVYEVSVTAGYACLAAAAWLFAGSGGSGEGEGRLSPARLALGGLALGLAAGCRPNHVLLVPVLPLLAWPALSIPGRRGRALLALGLPIGLCLLLLGAYNAARFGSFFDFGTSYQLGGMRPVPWFDPRALPPVVYFQFLAPPEARLEFPFFLPLTDYPGETPEGFFKEPYVVGLLAHSPIVLFTLAAPWLLRRARVAERAALGRSLLVLVAAGLVSPLLTALVFSAAAMRYQVDFASFLVLPGLLTWLVARQEAPGRRRRAVEATGLAACAWSWLLAVTLSLSGNYDELRRRNPELWGSLERRAEPLRIALGRLLDRDDRLAVRLRVAFPERTALEQEPFLSWGRVEAYDVLWVKTLGPGIFSFRLDTAASREDPARVAPATPGIRFEAGRFHDLDLDLDRVRRRVSATLDGAPAFSLEGRLVPLHPNRQWSSRGPRGHGAPHLGHFSGTIIPEAMVLAGAPGLETLPTILPVPAILTAAGEEAPSAAQPGQLWLVARKRGAYVFTGAAWRWIPREVVERVRLERQAPLPAAPPGSLLPILVSGDEGGADAVVARPLAGARVAFGLARWDGAWRTGPLGPSVPASLTPSLVVTLDRTAGLVTVTLAGREALRVSAELLPLRCALLRVAEAPRGMEF